jgi:amidase
MLSENSSKEELLQLKARIKRRCELFWKPMVKYQLDAILSNNNNAGHAAAATNYPALLFLWVTKDRRAMGSYIYS